MPLGHAFHLGTGCAVNWSTAWFTFNYHVHINSIQNLIPDILVEVWEHLVFELPYYLLFDITCITSVFSLFSLFFFFFLIVWADLHGMNKGKPSNTYKITRYITNSYFLLKIPCGVYIDRIHSLCKDTEYISLGMVYTENNASGLLSNCNCKQKTDRQIVVLFHWLCNFITTWTFTVVDFLNACTQYFCLWSIDLPQVQ